MDFFGNVMQDRQGKYRHYYMTKMLPAKFAPLNEWLKQRGSPVKQQQYFCGGRIMVPDFKIFAVLELCLLIKPDLLKGLDELNQWYHGLCTELSEAREAEKDMPFTIKYQDFCDPEMPGLDEGTKVQFALLPELVWGYVDKEGKKRMGAEF